MSSYKVGIPHFQILNTLRERKIFMYLHWRTWYLHIKAMHISGIISCRCVPALQKVEMDWETKNNVIISKNELVFFKKLRSADGAIYRQVKYIFILFKI